MEQPAPPEAPVAETGAMPPSEPQAEATAPPRASYEHVEVPWWHRVLEVAAITGVVIVLAMMAWEAYLYVLDWADFAWVAAVVVVSFVAADFTCGMVHWAADRIGTERTPIIGPGFIDNPARKTLPIRHGHLNFTGSKFLVLV